MTKFIDLNQYDACCCNLSGGKDSQVTLMMLAEESRRQGQFQRLFAVMAETGAEWNETLPHCQYLCHKLQVPLYVVKPVRPLPETIALRGRWPSMACRYCTSSAKNAPISKLIRNLFPHKSAAKVLMVSGERREESSRRAKLNAFQHDEKLSAGQRRVDWWRPVLELSKRDIWDSIHGSGLDYHVAYKRGNDRLSCALCVFANTTDLRNGAEARPDLAVEYLRIEAQNNHTFRYGQSLRSILQPDKGVLRL